MVGGYANDSFHVIMVLFIIIPPANCVCGWVYCFHVVRPSDRVCVCVCVCPLHFVSLITLGIFDGILSNFANTFI